MTNLAFFFKDFGAQGKEVPKFLKYTGAFDEKLLGIKRDAQNWVPFKKLKNELVGFYYKLSYFQNSSFASFLFKFFISLVGRQ